MSRSADDEPQAKRGGFATVSGAPPLDRLGAAAFAGTTLAGFEDLGRIGSGGMGDVHRVRDPALNRVMAMKILRAPLLVEPAALARFVAEAQATAQLAHPGIVPVHALGRLEDGRLWFTMQEVKGRTLGDVIGELHRASAADRWESSSSGWTFRRVIERFHSACEAVAYAHHRGVVHRDLKPENIMVGAYGEALVVDWGLAKIRGQGPDEAIVTARTEDDAQKTRMGTVAGTPAYMPPEQARGDIDAIDARSDVYALGAILYEILSGRAPYQGSSWRAVIQQVLAFAPDPPGRAVAPGETFTMDAATDDQAAPIGPPLPRELVDACTRAMSREPERRHADAGAFADDVASWLDGSRRQDQAQALTDEADEVVEDAIRMRIRGASTRDRAQAMIAALSSTASEQDEADAGALEDRADEADHRADVLLVRRVKLLHAALVTLPDFAPAHARLAWVYRHASLEAERQGDPSRALRDRELFHSHALALPEGDPDRAPHLAWMQGDGMVSLTDPAGAEVEIASMVRRGRRFVPDAPRPLGRTPLRRVPVPMGSHVLHIHGPGGVVQHPIEIGRAQHWQGVAAGADAITHDDVAHTSRLPGADLGSDAGSWPVRVKTLRDAVVMRMDMSIRGTQLVEATRAAAHELSADAELVDAVLDEIFGLGPLEALLRDQSVTTILADSAGELSVERGGVLHRIERGFRDDPHARRMVERILAAVGATLPSEDGESTGRLGDGSVLRAWSVQGRVAFRLERPPGRPGTPAAAA